MPCRMFSSIPGLYPVDTSSNLSIVTTKNVAEHCHISLAGGAVIKAPQVRLSLYTAITIWRDMNF